MDGLGVRPVLVVSVEEKDPTGASLFCDTKVEPLPKPIMVVAADSNSPGRRIGGEYGGILLLPSSNGGL